MADHTPDIVTYFLRLPLRGKEYLGYIRHWLNLKMAYDGELIWLTGFDRHQIDSPEVKSIPGAYSYLAQNGKLFRLNSLLPESDLPSLLWTPIDRALPVQLPLPNPNYFGLNQTVEPRLVVSDAERPAYAVMPDMNSLNQYIRTAPAVRLLPLQWTIINQQALIIGTPLLPISGQVYWRDAEFLIPAGCDFDFPVLAEVINQVINPGSHWVLWNPDSSYQVIDKRCVRPLTLSSFRQSYI